MEDFTSQGVSSQGAVLQIEGGTAGAAATITAITAANPPHISTTTPPAAGTVVTIAAVLGMTEINGKTGVVGNPVAGGFDLIGVDASGYTAYVSGGTATELPFLDICEAKTFTGFDGQASELDKSTMCSEAKEFVQGLQDFGSFTFEMNYVPDDPSQQALADAKAAGDTKWFRLIEPPELGGTIQFQAFVKSMSLAGGVDTVMTSSVALRVTGAPTRVAGA
jgi:hypothetical protein